MLKLFKTNDYDNFEVICIFNPRLIVRSPDIKQVFETGECFIFDPKNIKTNVNIKNIPFNQVINVNKIYLKYSYKKDFHPGCEVYILRKNSITFPNGKTYCVSPEHINLIASNKIFIQEIKIIINKKINLRKK